MSKLLLITASRTCCDTAQRHTHRTSSRTKCSDSHRIGSSCRQDILQWLEWRREFTFGHYVRRSKALCVSESQILKISVSNLVILLEMEMIRIPVQIDPFLLKTRIKYSVAHLVLSLFNTFVQQILNFLSFFSRIDYNLLTLAVSTVLLPSRSNSAVKRNSKTLSIESQHYKESASVRTLQSQSAATASIPQIDPHYAFLTPAWVDLLNFHVFLQCSSSSQQ